jgi:hypothetical protein
MKTRAQLMGAVLFIGACGGASPAPPARSAALSPAPEAATHEATTARSAASPEEQKESLLLADRLAREALAAPGRDARFAVDRQVGTLREAIALYRQFIDRAGGNPQFADEVRRSRERIDEANATITFLLAQPADAAP